MNDIHNTALWKLLKQKAEEERMSDKIVQAVDKVCQEGILKAKDIIRFFPNFTLHDETHICNVCEWMTRLLGNRKNELTACDAAMLLMAASCHDIGMSVSDGQKAELGKTVKKLLKTEEAPTEEQLREYVRQHHHERIVKEFRQARWKEIDADKALQGQGILHKHLVAICKSHGEPIESFTMSGNFPFDPRLCAVLLRLADILDFDATRAPQTLFEHMGLDSPEDLERAFSKAEWIKNRSGQFSITAKNQIRYTASYDDPNIEHKVTDYLKWVEQELHESAGFLSSFDGRWKDLRLPYKIYAEDDSIERNGYRGGDFLITMSQERIIDLLAGENLYGDSCVFVRELLQNAIDAILWRSKKDSDFDVSDGKINITVWHDETGQGWFRIEDNGTGMNEHILQNYFLKVGCSYYDSDDFREEDRTYSPKDSYKPISRFGIGILSCFMSDKRNTLEVSTKRYTHDVNQENPGIRLSVTGRNGYYSLAVEDEEDESPWQEMPDPDKDTHETYRTEPGTTICVGMNLFRLGNYRNIKEVVDKYVCFPDMQVTYRGPEGETTYPTKSDFLDAVEQLKAAHGDTFPIVCRHPIPDETFEELKNAFPNSEWDGKPELVLSYFPLDLFHTGNLCGMKIVPRINWHKKRIPFYFNYVFYELDLDVELIAFADNGKSIYVVCNCHFPAEVPYKMETLPPSVLQKEENQKAITEYDRLKKYFFLACPLSEVLSSSEKRIVRYVFQNSYGGTIAYNGVVAGAEFGNDDKNLKLLLSGSYAPGVNVARNKVSSFPVEAEFEWKCLVRIIGREKDSFYSISKNLFLTERKLRELLDNHPEWKKELLDAAFDDEQVAAIREKRFEENLPIDFEQLSLFDTMLLALLKRDFKLCYVGNKTICLSEKTADSDITLDFPVQLFFSFPAGDTRFSIRIGKSIGSWIYSISHAFSQWLIKNRSALEKELPEVYRKLLQTLINDSTVIMNELNARLAQLKQYRHNCFNITDDLFLKESDFEE